MMERIVALGADYAATIGALARTEAAQDAARLRAAARATAIAAAVLALGAVWLNVGVLLWLLTTPHPILGAFAIGAVALVVGLVMSASARRGVESLRLLEGTRRVLADELGARDPSAPHAPSPPLHPAEAGARLHAIREELRETIALHRGPQGEPVEEPILASFEPRSTTMRTALWLWRAVGRVPQGTAMAGVLGLLALGSPKLRRLLAVLALLRNLGANPRMHVRPGHDASPYPSP
jgi:hypothetical protein